jgi:hypothetical protein
MQYREPLRSLDDDEGTIHIPGVDSHTALCGAPCIDRGNGPAFYLAEEYDFDAPDFCDACGDEYRSVRDVLAEAWEAIKGDMRAVSDYRSAP